MVYIVLGMHKSGTTLVARALHESGIVMGQEFPKNADYAKVKYEAQNAQTLTDEILKLSRKTLSLDVTSSALPEEGVEKATLNRMNNMVSEMNAKYDDWGFKDPRAALTYRYWRQVLPEHRVIVIYRDPVEVWRRYARVNHKWWSRQAFNVWFDYNSNILDSVASMDKAEVLYINFEELLSTDTEWERLQSFVGKKLTDVRNPNQSRFSVSSEQHDSLTYKFLNFTAGQQVGDLYQKLERLREG